MKSKMSIIRAGFGGDIPKANNLNLPKNKNTSSVSLSIQPGYASGSYTSKKGNTISADYDSYGKSFSVGAKININKKRKK